MFGALLIAALSCFFVINANNSWNDFINHLIPGESNTLFSLSIFDFDGLEYYFDNHPLSVGYYSAGLSNIDNSTLHSLYSSYYFSTPEEHLTSDASGGIPIEVQSTAFSSDIILGEIEEIGFPSTYGGCGPIAMMGIFDYFARYLNFTQIESNPNSDDCKHDIANQVLSNSYTIDLSLFTPGQPSTFMPPWSYKAAFDAVTNNKDVSDYLICNYIFTLFGGHMDYYWENIVSYIDKGIPVTLMTSNLSGGPEFGSHYTNIFGYDIVHFDDHNGHTGNMRFLKARVNRYNDADKFFYCDARILNDPLIGIVTYDMPVNSITHLNASDTANVFVNANGGGQYFYYPKVSDLVLDNETHSTWRLRTSYIENQYLVMSPKKEGAGTAYLGLAPFGRPKFLKFDAGLWSNAESIYGEKFFIRVARPGVGWINLVEFDLTKFSTKENMKTYWVTIPHGSTFIEFYATHDYPTGTWNKGRIVLDHIEYQLGYI